jgi:glycosyltransferase involved in cell wall biosynthesis
VNIGILVPVLSDRDAVGADAIEMASVLERLGHRVRLFAHSTLGNVGNVAKPAALAEFCASPGDLAIYHFSIGWPDAVPLLRSLRCRRIVRYHNITPAHFFEGYSTEYVNACAFGRSEIAAFAALECDLYLGDSPFNVEDFLAAGVARERTAVLPPFHRIDRLVRAHADLALLDRYQDGAATWLSVGRLAPNKGHLNLIDAFAAYRLACDDPSARLLIVGRADPRLASYTASIRSLVAQRGLESSVHFLSDIDESALKAVYLVADALVSLSEHEGFCVPLIEAMALGTPIVGYTGGAVAWTTGDAGVIWDETDPHLFAAPLARLRSDASLRHLLRERGLRRMEEAFSTEALTGTLGEVIGRFA